MNKEILKNLMRTSSVEFTYDEINEMLNEELEKFPEEMDTELVEICIDALSSFIDEGNKPAEKESVQEKTKTSKKSIVKKIFLVAAIVSVILTLSITVSANIFDIDLPEGMVKIFGDRIVLNLSGEAKDNNSLDEDGLFSVFSSEKCAIESKVFNENKKETKIQFSVKESEIYGNIVILPYYLIENGLKDNNVFINVEQMEQIIIGTTEIVIASSTNGLVFVRYCTDEKNILINFFNASIDEVIKFLKIGTGE